MGFVSELLEKIRNSEKKKLMYMYKLNLYHNPLSSYKSNN